MRRGGVKSIQRLRFLQSISQSLSIQYTSNTNQTLFFLRYYMLNFYPLYKRTEAKVGAIRQKSYS